MKIVLLNTSILTAFGSFEYRPASLEEIKNIVHSADEVVSAIGHQSTADILSELLERDVPVNRILYQQQPGEVAAVFKLNGRPEEGKILSREEIEEIGYQFGLLKMRAE
jgi:hypothetical protein